MNTSKHKVMCDGECIRECDTVQESIAFSVRLTIEGEENGLRLECRVEEDNNEGSK
jgi:hypothetical protein